MQISGAYKDIAANLQRQIDACVKIADKATDDDVNNGIANKWVDAAHANNMPFSVLAQQSIAQFVSGDSIYLSGQPILPTIQDDLYKAFIRAK